jgi:hypothetical protein
MPMGLKHIHAINTAPLASKLSCYLMRNVLSVLPNWRETGQFSTLARLQS